MRTPQAQPSFAPLPRVPSDSNTHHEAQHPLNSLLQEWCGLVRRGRGMVSYISGSPGLEWCLKTLPYITYWKSSAWLSNPARRGTGRRERRQRIHKLPRFPLKASHTKLPGLRSNGLTLNA